MKQLFLTRPKRFFAFGCSFTNYIWSSWADILAHDLKIPYWNYGVPGSGNQFIANTIAQADNHHDFNSDDLVIVSWTHACREDRFVNGKWLWNGNVYTSDDYDSSFREKYCDPVGFLIRDLATIKFVNHFLSQKKCQWHFLSMSNITDLKDFFLDQLHSVEYNDKVCFTIDGYQSTIDSICPSFYQVLWSNDLSLKKEADNKLISEYYQDYHPTPIEHFTYLQKTFDYKFSTDTQSDVILYYNQFKTETVNYASKIRKQFNPCDIPDQRWWDAVKNSPFPKSEKCFRL